MLTQTHIDVTVGAVALAECVAESPILIRLDLRENDIKTAGLMALSLALKVNESVHRIDIDQNSKRESVGSQNKIKANLKVTYFVSVFSHFMPF